MLSPDNMRQFIFMITALFLTACQTGGSSLAQVNDQQELLSEVPVKYLSGMNAPKYHLVESEIVGRPFHLYVRLPEDYDPTLSYPTIYLLDGGITFPLLSSYYRYLSLGEEIQPSILVGIAYSGSDFPSGNYRSTDFTAPSNERKYWGGAARFSEVFRSEIFPLIDENYASDSTTRIIWGQSLGGQYAIFAALNEPGLFWGHIASNPALHRNLDTFLSHKDTGGLEYNPKLFVVSGQNDDPVFREPAQKWINHWSSAPDLPFDLAVKSAPGHNHFSLAPFSFRHGLVWMFSDIQDR